MNLHIMSGMPHKVSETVTAVEINFMDLWDHPVLIEVEAAPHPEDGQPTTKLTLSVKADDKEVSKTIYAPPAPDHTVLLFSLAMGPSDYFVLQVMTPFMQEVCEMLGVPMIRVIKPE